MAFLQEIITDCNGFVLFDPGTLADVLGRQPGEGGNLLVDFKSDDVGDRVLEEGAVVPIYPITDGNYVVSVRVENEPRPAFAAGEPYAVTGVHPLVIRSRAILADLAVLQEWLPELGWRPLELERGFYEARVFAYLGTDVPGFDVVLSRVNEKPVRTADWDSRIDVGSGPRG